jgi:hypothetical protein
MRRETAALREFDPAYVGLGSISTLLAEATRPFMSAMPPIATKAVRVTAKRRDVPLGAATHHTLNVSPCAASQVVLAVSAVLTV